MKVERMTYAGFKFSKIDYYRDIHGLIESYGGRVKDCQYKWDEKTILIFYEMTKSNEVTFESEMDKIPYTYHNGDGKQ